MAHRDVLGKELAVGDYVVYIVPVYHDLALGRVIGFSPKEVRIMYTDRSGKEHTLTRRPSIVVKVDPNKDA